MKGSKQPREERIAIGRRIESLAKEIGISIAAELARRIGLKTQSVQQWYSGQTSPRGRNLAKLSELFGRSIDEILGRSTPPSLARRGYVSIPLLDVQGSAGPGTHAPEFSDVLQQIEVLESRVRQQLHATARHLRLISARGDSMAPTIQDSDVVFVDVSARAVEGAGVYVIDWHGRLLIKRLQPMLDGRLAIQSDNARYMTEYVPVDHMDRLTICGRVKGRWSLEKF
jgi:transcriptional regulator with XRE-family HTH domain